MLRLEQKLARIRAGAYRRQDFIIADAKDPDMGPGCTRSDRLANATVPRIAFAPAGNSSNSIEAVVKQDVVDIMLTSVSNLEKLVERDAFSGTGVKPAIRANDTTDIWRHRGATISHSRRSPSVPHGLARRRLRKAR